jgi:hypothetical protein
MNKFIRKLVAAPVLALAASAGHAATFSVADPQGDFLSTYAGTQAGDLDVLFAYGLFDATASTFTFGATMSAPVGTTAGATYIWGINRGGGTERLNTGALPVGAGVRFDAVIALNTLSGGGGAVNLFNGNPATSLPSGAVSIVGNSITLTLAAGLLPNNGTGFANYQFNLWPRLGVGNNNQISDFAPNNSSIGVLAVTPVPEPDALALMLAGLGLVGFTARRRSKAA